MRIATKHTVAAARLREAALAFDRIGDILQPLVIACETAEEAYDLARGWTPSCNEAAERIEQAQSDLVTAAFKAVAYEKVQTQEMNGDDHSNGSRPPTGDDWNDLSACVRGLAAVLVDPVLVDPAKTFICRKTRNYSIAIQAETREEAERKADATPLEQWDGETVDDETEEE